MHRSYNAEDLAKVSYDINKLILVLEKTFTVTNWYGLEVLPWKNPYKQGK